MIISVITPSYNQGQFLAETIESVIRQEGDFSIDYLIIDGGSSDDSLAIIKHYDTLLRNREWPIACRGITYRWISERDNGQTDALMKGFRLAQGDIFAWLNSDDTYLPGTLETVAGAFRVHADTGLLYGDAHYCDTAGAVIGRYRTEEFDLDRLASANIVCQPAAFFRRQAFTAVGGLDVTLHFAMDYDLWIRIGRRFSCHHIPRMLATYRLHETSKTISSDTLIRNSEESLGVTRRHFGWAPLTRVYTSCSILCAARLPGLFGNSRLALAAAASACTLIRSLVLNRGFHRNDLKLLNRENFRKLCRSRIEIMTGGKP
ncbi:glycosyltransferase family 2 protein [Geomobilimonas luticola]|uniref:Glycosyltransferase n=1 Tax=Geomobilimonas luticola TaxID=1114878 RepID=A0ABS5SEP1_9BACT|nr:glycosyltransferase family 2 protein [Geomobilimonas luticola]MBT0653841.1 glycosyltransferase [Geomobilimonas luticola]